MKHATHYSKPSEQRQYVNLSSGGVFLSRAKLTVAPACSIVRILWMVPIYSLVAWLSIFFYKNSVYYSLIGTAYEAFTISAFFALLCHYIAPDLHSQKEYFRQIKPKPWVWPVNWLQKCCGGEHGVWRTPRSGLTWFNVCMITHGYLGDLQADVVLDRLGQCFPILSFPRSYDDYRGYYTGQWRVL